MSRPETSDLVRMIRTHSLVAAEVANRTDGGQQAAAEKDVWRYDEIRRRVELYPRLVAFVEEAMPWFTPSHEEELRRKGAALLAECGEGGDANQQA